MSSFNAQSSSNVAIDRINNKDDLSKNTDDTYNGLV